MAYKASNQTLRQLCLNSFDVLRMVFRSDNEPTCRNKDNTDWYDTCDGDKYYAEKKILYNKCAKSKLSFQTWQYRELLTWRAPFEINRLSLLNDVEKSHFFVEKHVSAKEKNRNEYEREKTKKIGRKRSVYYFIKTKRMNGQKYALHMAYIWRFISKTLRNMKQRFFSKALFLHTHFLWNGLRFDVPRIVSIFTVCWMIYFTVMNRERAFYFLLHFFRACRVMRGS